jgi:Glycosyl transferase family 2
VPHHIDRETALFENALQRPLLVAAFVSEISICTPVEDWMGRDKEEQPTTRGKEIVKAPERSRIVADVLQDVQTDDRVERPRESGRLDDLSLPLDNSNAIGAGEAVSQRRCKHRIGLEGDDELALASGELTERTQTCSDIEHSAPEVRPQAVEEPCVVVVGRRHPPQGLSLQNRLGPLDRFHPRHGNIVSGPGSRAGLQTLLARVLNRAVLESRTRLPPMRVSFLIPAYNEAATIGEVLDRIAALDLDRQVIVVDDGSTDETAAIAERACQDGDALVLRQANRGKGAAIRAAIRHMDGEIAVIQDADMEYDPIDVPALIEPIQRGAADVVFGSRLSGGRPQRAHLFWHLVGNRFLSLLTNLLFNTTISDMETGYKVFRADVLRSLDLRQDGFGIEPELTAQVCLRKLRIYQLPIAYYGRTYDEGKKITWRDGLKAVKILIALRVRG